MSQNFNDIYPTKQDVVDDMQETIANICETTAERNVLYRQLNSFRASGLDKVELYQAMQKQFEAHAKMKD